MSLGRRRCVWAAGLDVEPGRRTALEALLSGDERARSMRYRRPTDRERFIVRRATLRMGLGRLLDVPPEQIAFGYGTHGKPYVREPVAGRIVRFNVAHSDGLAVFGCALGCEIGIDVERVLEQPDLLDVAASCFSPREQRTLTGLPRAAQASAFYRCWTRKEAYVKAIGSGLGAPLQEFDVAFGAEELPRLRVGWRNDEPARWRMEALAVPDSYVGALVVQRRELLHMRTGRV